MMPFGNFWQLSGVVFAVSYPADLVKKKIYQLKLIQKRGGGLNFDFILYLPDLVWIDLKKTNYLKKHFFN